MIRVRHLAILTAAGLLLGTAGCTRAPAVPRMVNGVPVDWKTYSPPEGDFRVSAPADPTVIPTKEEEQNVRAYVFRKGDATLTVLLFERKGKATERDKPEGIKADPKVIEKSMRVVELTGMTGLEYLYNDPQDGVCLMRVYRSADGKRSITLRVVKPEDLSGPETNAFLDSFKLTEK